MPTGLNKRSTGWEHGGYQRADLFIYVSGVSFFRDAQYCVYLLLWCVFLCR